jgi:peptide chain release factor 3
VVDIATKTAHLFDEKSGDRRIAFRSVPLAELAGDESIRPEVVSQAADEVELLSLAGDAFDREKFIGGKLTPVFFGSALTNYGVEHFLRGFLELCPPPADRESDVGVVPAARADFAGFVFKIQANLDPRHRDRIAFVRICSGRFRRDMEVTHSRSGKKLRLRRAHKVFGQERETMDEAFPGDIIGLVNPGEFFLGDTICEGAPVNFEALPQFSPENFAVVRCKETDRRKQFDRGLKQLLEEGAIQVFTEPRAMRRDPVLGAVGVLQFDVVRFRLESEYNTATDIEWLPFKLARWIDADEELLRKLKLPYSSKLVQNQLGHYAVLFQSTWDADHAERENPKVQFTTIRTSSASAGNEWQTVGY